MVRKQYLWTDPDGVNRWHDEPAPDPRFKKQTKDVSFGANGWSTGISSDSAGIHPSQIESFREDAQKQGFTGVDFKPDGTAVFTSRSQRAAYLKHRGLYDRDAGYGDASPDNI